MEDLYDSTGVDGLLDRPISSMVDMNPNSSGEGEEPEQRNAVSKEAEPDIQSSCPKFPEQMSANGRALLRKHFSTTSPVELPRGHTTVAFTEPQIHAVLKTISDEAVRTSLHSMRALVLQAVYGGKGQTPARFRKALIRGESPFKAKAATSEIETDSEGYTTDGYTSGALASDEEIGIAGFGSGAQAGSGKSTQELPGGPMEGESLPGGSHCTVPSPGYSEGDYQPLSIIQVQTAPQGAVSSLPREKRKLMSRPGKVMKPASFEDIPWTRVFVTGPLDPMHNKHSIYCQLCKTNVSIYSKGAREIVKHYQSEAHLRRDKRWRYEHLGKFDKITGVNVHAVRGRDGHIQSALELEKEKPLFEFAPLMDIGPRFPFYEEYTAGVGGLSNPEDVRISPQKSLIARFVPHFGNLDVLEGLWTEVGNFTNHQEMFGDLDWSSTMITVSR